MLQSSFLAVLHLKSMAFCSYPSSVITKTSIFYPHFSYETRQICSTSLQFGIVWVLISCLIMITHEVGVVLNQQNCSWSLGHICLKARYLFYWVIDLFQCSISCQLSHYHMLFFIQSSKTMFLTNYCILCPGDLCTC